MATKHSLCPSLGFHHFFAGLISPNQYLCPSSLKSTLDFRVSVISQKRNIINMPLLTSKSSTCSWVPAKYNPNLFQLHYGFYNLATIYFLSFVSISSLNCILWSHKHFWSCLNTLPTPGLFTCVVSSAGKTPVLALKSNLSFNAHSKSSSSVNGVYYYVLKT